MKKGDKMKNILTGIIAMTMLFGTLSGCTQAKPQAPASDEKAADFTLPLLDGNNITLSEALKNKKAVLVFWTTWCPYCVKEVPAVESFYKKNSNVAQVIAINLQESAQKVKSFVEKNAITYPVALDAQGTTAKLYGVRGIPTIVAIDKDSKILYYGHSIEEMENNVNFNQ